MKISELRKAYGLKDSDLMKVRVDRGYNDGLRSSFVTIILGSMDPNEESPEYLEIDNEGFVAREYYDTFITKPEPVENGFKITIEGEGFYTDLTFIKTEGETGPQLPAVY